MRAILSLILIVSATAFNLPAPTISAAVSHNFNYQVAIGESIPSLTQKISNIQPKLGFQDAKYLQQIGGDLKFHIDAMQTTPYRSLTWSLKINKQLGVLRVIQITATLQASTKTLNINGKYVEVTQKIPAVFNVTRTCHKGKRKLGIGKRKVKCQDVSTPRGLNAQEIAQVNQNLMKMLPQAQARLK